MLSWKRDDLFNHPSLPVRLKHLKEDAARLEWRDWQQSDEQRTLREFQKRVRLPMTWLKQKNKLWAAIYRLPKMSEGTGTTREKIEFDPEKVRAYVRNFLNARNALDSKDRQKEKAGDGHSHDKACCHG